MSKDGSVRNPVVKAAPLAALVKDGYPSGQEQTQCFLDYHKNENAKVKNASTKLLSWENLCTPKMMVSVWYLGGSKSFLNECVTQAQKI